MSIIIDRQPGWLAQTFCDVERCTWRSGFRTGARRVDAINEAQRLHHHEDNFDHTRIDPACVCGKHGVAWQDCPVEHKSAETSHRAPITTSN